MNFRDRSIAFRFLADILCVSLAFFFAVWLSHNLNFPFRKRDLLHWFILLFGWFQFVDNLEYYNNFRLKNVAHDLLITIRVAIIMVIVYGISAFLLDTGGDERVGFLTFFVVLLPILFIRKYIFRRLFHFLSSNNKDKVVFVGNSKVSNEIYDAMRRRPWMGYSVMGRLDLDKNYDTVHMLQELAGLLETVKPNRIFVDEKSIRRQDLDQVVSECLSHTVQPFILPEGLKFFSERFQVQFFDDIPIIAVRKNPLERFRYRSLKRGFDLLFSGLLLLTVLPPVFLFLAILIRIDSRGPILFVQTRWGLNNVPFNTLKFRSMRSDSTDTRDGKYQQAKKGDPRITKVGAFLRKSNLDELPQFINVFRGDMSVVGPRPHPGPLNVESRAVVDNYLQRHLVKPGITGWAQVNGARGETRQIAQMQKRVDYDIWYIENWSFLLDIRIIFQTVWNMYKGEKHAY